MTTATGKQFAVGLRQVMIFDLDQNGLLNVTTAGSASPYEGSQLVGGQGLELNIPEPRRIQHTGDDRLQQVDFLPTLDPVTGTLTISRQDYPNYALLTGTSVQTIGEVKAIGIMTDKQGSEPQVGMLAWQQSQDNTGERNYRAFILPKSLVYPRPGPMNQNATTHTFDVQPQIVTQNLWGSAFSNSIEGFLSAAYRELQFQYKPKLIAWKTAGSASVAGSLAFVFDGVADPAKTPVASAKINAFLNTGGSIAVTYGAGSPPTTPAFIYYSGSIAAGDTISCLYETP